MFRCRPQRHRWEHRHPCRGERRHRPTQPQVARAQGTSHVPVDASPLGPLPSPLSRPEVADNIWSWQPLSTATTVSAVLVEEEVVEEEDYHSV